MVEIILTVRGVQVMLDRDLAMLYGVETKVLNQAVKRNIERFPTDFMFQLTQDEAVCSRSQFVTLNNSRGHNIKYLPYVFTENGIAMLSGVLRSPTAVKVNIRIVLFDNYVDDTVLTILDKRRENVSATIFTKAVSAQLELDIAKHNAQYRPIEIKSFDKVHDRFLCIDSTVVGVKDYFSFFTRFTVCLIFPIIKLSSSDDSVSDVSRSGITMSVSISPKCCILWSKFLTANFVIHSW